MGEYQVRSIDVRVPLLLINPTCSLLKSAACSSLFQHVFNGAKSIGAMCEALKCFAAVGSGKHGGIRDETAKVLLLKKRSILDRFHSRMNNKNLAKDIDR